MMQNIHQDGVNYSETPETEHSSNGDDLQSEIEQNTHQDDAISSEGSETGQDFHDDTLQSEIEQNTHQDDVISSGGSETGQDSHDDNSQSEIEQNVHQDGTSFLEGSGAEQNFHGGNLQSETGQNISRNNVNSSEISETGQDFHSNHPYLATERNVNQFGTSSSQGSGTAPPNNYDYILGDSHMADLGTVLIIAVGVSALMIFVYHCLMNSLSKRKSSEDNKNDSLQGNQGNAITGHPTGVLPSDVKGGMTEAEFEGIFKREFQALEKRMTHTLKETLNEHGLGHKQPSQNAESARGNVHAYADSEDGQNNSSKRDEETPVTTIEHEIFGIVKKYCAAEIGSVTDREDFLTNHKKLYYDFGLASLDDSYDRQEYNLREFIKNPSSPSMLLFLLQDGETGLILPKFKQASSGKSNFTKDGCHKFFKVDSDSWNGLLHLTQPAIVKFSSCKTFIESIVKQGEIG